MDKAAYRKNILQEIDELRALSNGSKEGRAPVELDKQSVGRLSQMEAMQQQSIDVAREERRRHRLAVLNSALRRVDEHEYGYCLACSQDILPERLDIDLAVTLCVTCQAKR